MVRPTELLTEPGAKRRRDRLSFTDEVRLGEVGVHHSIFVEKRGRCQWATRKATTGRRPNGYPKESRPLSQCSIFNGFFVYKKEETCLWNFMMNLYLHLKSSF